MAVASNTANGSRLEQLILARKRGFALDSAFYRSAEVYARDVERVFMQVWMYAGHVSEIPEPGSYFLHEIAGESVIITRDGNGDIQALVNVCRHRGSRVCVEQHGKVKTFVCKYHGWTYGLDGALRSRRYMPTISTVRLMACTASNCTFSKE